MVMTTSTVYDTVVRTMATCPPWVVSCHVNGYVVTETMALYTTVCPVAWTAQPVEPTVMQAGVPLSTRTVYKTSIYTVAWCAPEEVDCHKGQATTKTMSSYITVYPVMPTAHAEEPTSAESSPPETETARGSVASTGHSTEETLSMKSCLAGVSECPHKEVTTEDMAEVPRAGLEGDKGTATTPVHDVETSSTLHGQSKAGKECNGPGCPGRGCIGADCPVGSGMAKAPGNGCSGAECASAALGPVERLGPSASRPSAPRGKAVEGSASGVAVRLTGLAAVAAGQLLALGWA